MPFQVYILCVFVGMTPSIAALYITCQVFYGYPTVLHPIYTFLALRPISLVPVLPCLHAVGRFALPLVAFLQMQISVTGFSTHMAVADLQVVGSLACRQLAPG